MSSARTISCACPRRGWPLQPPVDDSAQIPPRSHSVVGVTARADETPVLVGLLAPLCFALFHFRMRPCAPSRFRLGLGTIAQKRSVIYCPHAFNPRRLRCAIFTGPPLGHRPAGRLAPARCLVPAGAKRNAIERDGAEDRFLRHRSASRITSIAGTTTLMENIAGSACGAAS